MIKRMYVDTDSGRIELKKVCGTLAEIIAAVNGYVWAMDFIKDSRRLVAGYEKITVEYTYIFYPNGDYKLIW